MTDKNTVKALLEVKSLCAYIGKKKLVDELSFSIAAGEKLALVGESGSGKSISAQALLRLNPDVILSGEVCYNNQNLLSLSPRKISKIRAREIGMIFQEPMSALNPVMSIGKQIIEVLQIHLGLNKKVARMRTIDLLQQTGIEDAVSKVDAYPFQLSGGQRQRAMIAMALAAEPKLLIADEPTTALDVSVQAQILELLNRLQKNTGMAVLFITHDLNLVRRFADRVAVMQNGKIVEQGSVDYIFNSAKHPHTQELLSSQVEALLPETNIGESQIRISAKQLNVSFNRRVGLFRRQIIPIVHEVNLSVGLAKTLGIVGESGSGKTTLGLALMRLIDSDGRIELDGMRLDDLSGELLRHARRDFQVVFQDPFSSLSPRLTVEEIVSEGLALHESALSKQQIKTRVCAMLSEVGLSSDESILSRYPHEFSGGQRQRIAIARAVILRPKVLMLDEPTSALDASLQKQVIALLLDLQRKYSISYLFISHDLNLIRAIAHQLVVLRSGRIIEYGKTAKVFANPNEKYTKELLAASALI